MTSKSLVTTTPTTVLELLRQARKLISNPDKWTKRTYARNAKDSSCDVESSEAYKFCMIGALQRVLPSPDHYRSGLYDCAHRLLTEACEKPPSLFNDYPETQHKDVLLAYDTAIQLAGGPPR